MMKCPNCKYELTEGERLLCSVPGGHYCPRCWARIPEPAEVVHNGVDLSSDEGDSDTNERQITGRQL